MMLNYTTNTSSAQDILHHLQVCDTSFSPPLSSRTNLNSYARTLEAYAERVEVWNQIELVGLLAVYCNSEDRVSAFVSNVSVVPDHSGQGIGKRLITNCIYHVTGLGFTQIALDVSINAQPALRLYERFGFTQSDQPSKDASTLRLTRALR